MDEWLLWHGVCRLQRAHEMSDSLNIVYYKLASTSFLYLSSCPELCLKSDRCLARTGYLGELHHEYINNEKICFAKIKYKIKYNCRAPAAKIYWAATLLLFKLCYSITNKGSLQLCTNAVMSTVFVTLNVSLNTGMCLRYINNVQNWNLWCTWLYCCSAF